MPGTAQPGAPEYAQGGLTPGMPEPDGDVLTEERMSGIVKTFLVTTPNIFKKPWLATPEEDLQPFVHELTIYCRNHDIDPAEYFGDWFPLVMCSIPISAGILQRHRDHKKGTVTEKKELKDSASKAGYSEPHTPVEPKEAERNESSGTNLPESEAEKEPETPQEMRTYGTEPYPVDNENDDADDASRGTAE